VRVAAIDIGTNTVLLLVAERRGDGLLAVEERATITRLGEGVDKTKALAPAAIARTAAALDAYGEIVAGLGATRVDVVGTSAMRDAAGSDALREHVKRVFGVEARTISGDEEARLTFAGARSGLANVPAEAAVRVFDIGGGSTEVVHGRGDAIQFARSFDVGSVRLTERHVKTDPPARSEIEALREDARRAFEVPAFESAHPPIGIAGTMTTLAAVSLALEPYDGARVHGLTMRVSDLENVVRGLEQKPLAERSRVPGLEPKRADVIVAGGHIALAYLERIGAEEVVISDRGVRWGLAEQLAS
jgi:exopolyphosphatase / guanosine-5'-triphosphate,3'-diphosphate pyrophosphatase